MAIAFPDLPYSLDALEPFLSAATMTVHHGKHHRGYVDKLNRQVAGTVHADATLLEIIEAAHAAGDQAVFNNAAQSFNHEFLWQSMSPSGGGRPVGALAEAIDQSFGSYADFEQSFKDAAASQFGSGWAWLVDDAGDLRVIKTGNADTPIVRSLKPLLTLDVWEHAYYLDYQNQRGAYIDAFLSSAVNWEFASENFRSKDA